MEDVTRSIPGFTGIGTPPAPDLQVREIPNQIGSLMAAIEELDSTVCKLTDVMYATLKHPPSPSPNAPMVSEQGIEMSPLAVEIRQANIKITELNRAIRNLISISDL